MCWNKSSEECSSIAWKIYQMALAGALSTTRCGSWLFSDNPIGTPLPHIHIMCRSSRSDGSLRHSILPTPPSPAPLGRPTSNSAASRDDGAHFYNWTICYLCFMFPHQSKDTFMRASWSLRDKCLPCAEKGFKGSVSST